MNSIKIIFTASLVSVLSLETAMLTSFGNGDKNFNTLVTALTSGRIGIYILGQALYMIIDSSIKIKEVKQ